LALDVIVPFAANAASGIEDCPDFFCIQKIRCAPISLLDQLSLHVIPDPALAGSGCQLHSLPKYLLIFPSRRASGIWHC
jgi:hypothetical protein